MGTLLNTHSIIKRNLCRIFQCMDQGIKHKIVHITNVQSQTITPIQPDLNDDVTQPTSSSANLGDGTTGPTSKYHCSTNSKQGQSTNSDNEDDDYLSQIQRSRLNANLWWQKTRPEVKNLVNSSISSCWNFRNQSTPTKPLWLVTGACNWQPIMITKMSNQQQRQQQLPNPNIIRWFLTQVAFFPPTRILKCV